MDCQITMKEGLSRILAALSIPRELNDKIPSQHIVAFLLIALYPAMTVQDLVARLGLAFASGSRAVAELSEGLNGKEGYGLLEVIVDPDNFRQKRIFLSPKGSDLATRILLAVFPGDELTATSFMNPSEWKSGRSHLRG